jgi:hypothetical protein
MLQAAGSLHYYFFFFVVILGFESVLCTCKSSILLLDPVHFILIILEMGVSQTICLG